jgi:hypothetical protein
MIRIFMKESATLRRLANGLARCRLYQLRTSIGSICINGDSPCAVGMARRLRARLEAAGVQIAGFAPAGAASECRLPRFLRQG